MRIGRGRIRRAEDQTARQTRHRSRRSSEPTERAASTKGICQCHTAADVSSTTPTPTSWRRRPGCATTPTRPSATGSSRCAIRAATSCARPATRRSSCATSTPRSTGWPTSTAPTEYRADEADEIMARKNFAATGSFLAEDRPRALDLLGFSSQLVFNTFHNRRLARLGAQRRPRPRVRRRARPQPGDDRVLRGRPAAAARLLRAARRLRPGRRDGRRGDRDGRRRAAGRVGLPAGPLAEPHRPRPGVGARAGGGHPDRVPRRRHRRPHRPELLPQRPADPARLPRRRGELPLGRLHGHPATRRRRRSPR